MVTHELVQEIINTIKEMTDHKEDKDCHKKCHEISDYCVIVLHELKKSENIHSGVEGTTI